MTNLKDLLNDFAEEILKVIENKDDNNFNWEIEKKEKIEDLLQIIKDRLIGY
jgi:hypothetical protein